MALLILDATTKSIVVAMSGAAATTNPDFTAAWADNNGTIFTEGATDGALNGTSSVTLVTAPAASTRRTIKAITIENKDTAAVTLTISYNNNSTLRTIAKVTLQVGDTWTTDGTFDTNGSLKQTLGTVNLASVTGTLGTANGGTGTTSGTSGGVLYYSATGTIASSGLLAANALVIGGGAGVAPSTITTGTGVVTALGVNTGSAGAFVVNGGALGTPSSGTVTNLTGTASININGTVGATTPTTGAFTTVAASSTVTLSGLTASTALALDASKNVVSVTNTGTGNNVLATSPTLTTPILGTPTSGNLSNCTADGTNSVGYRNIPQSGSDKTSSYTLATTDVGKFIGVGTSGSIVVPNSTFAAGDVVSIFNNTSGSITITTNPTSSYIAGANTTKASVSLATRGVATILFISGTVCVISGNVS